MGFGNLNRVWGPALVYLALRGDRCGWAPLPRLRDSTFTQACGSTGVSVGVDFDFGLRPNHFTFVSMHDSLIATWGITDWLRADGQNILSQNRTRESRWWR